VNCRLDAGWMPPGATGQGYAVNAFLGHTYFFTGGSKPLPSPGCIPQAWGLPVGRGPGRGVFRPGRDETRGHSL
jgi:hypothetical protein